MWPSSGQHGEVGLRKAGGDVLGVGQGAVAVQPAVVEADGHPYLVDSENPTH